MKEKSVPQSKGEEPSLRERAKKLFREKSENLVEFSNTQIRYLIHELQAHQIELETQNQELRRTQLDLEESAKKYSDLYDFAPVGYFTLSEKGIVLKVNLAASSLLGVDRHNLIGRPFSRYIAKENNNRFYYFRKRILETNTRQTGELKMLRRDGTPFYAQLIGTTAFDSDMHSGSIRMALLDVTERKQAEEVLRNAHDQLEIIVQERSSELIRVNEILQAEVTERKKSEESLRKALSEIEHLKNQLQAENIYLREEIKLEHSYKEIVGHSRAIKTVLGQVEQVAKTDSTVLILGETGTGKELLAWAIHNQSRRKGRAMVKVNCAGLPPALIENELFGREKGAYTGASTKQIGRFEVANGSTIFLDEIGELPLELQAKLLRVLQEGKFEHLGSPNTIKVDVRVIAASNRDLSKAVNESGFREDLYYRLNVFPIYVPPLRERREDIPALVWTFVKEYGEKMRKTIESIPRRSMEALQSYYWPGNVRELRNVIERAMILASNSVLQVELPGVLGSKIPQIMSLEDMERNYIIKVLEMTNWRVRGKNGAAEILGLKPSTLEWRMLKLGIRRNK